MTRRLREMEEELTDFHMGGYHGIGQELRIEGYKAALDDLRPALDAARDIATPNDHEPECRSCKTNLHVLRDALAGLEVQDD